MGANLVLWVLQILLALAFAAAGYGHAFSFDRMSSQPGTGWMLAVGRGSMRTIGLLEILGAIGLVLPAATGVLPWLTPTAAACLVVLMALAGRFHARRAGEGRSIGLNAALGIVALVVAVGRSVVAPL